MYHIGPSAVVQDHQLSVTEQVYGMANLGSKKTGLPMVVWVSPKNAPHGPRLKVSQRYGDKTRVGEWFTMTLEDEPRVIGELGQIRQKDIELVEEFIKKNKSLLLAYWDQDEYVDTSDLIEGLQRVDSQL
jgi:hypothetical protein